MQPDFSLLKELSEALGPSGFEDTVRLIIKKKLEKLGFKSAEDGLGNLFVRLGEGRPLTLIAAHMDEVGFIVKYIMSNGFLRVASLGGVNPGIMPGTSVAILGEKGVVKGVFGTIPPHLLKRGDGQREVRVEDLYVDIGASSREEVEASGIKLGTPLTFDTDFWDLGEAVSGKAFDDRLGCFALLEALRTAEPPSRGSVIIAFTVQEEVGTRGASVLAHRFNPDYGISVEGTIASDVPGVSEENWVTALGRGPAVRVFDATIVASRQLVDYVLNVAESAGIPVQIQLSPHSGTDAGRFVLLGARPGNISIPARYIHSPRALSLKSDIEYAVKIIREIIEKPPP